MSGFTSRGFRIPTGPDTPDVVRDVTNLANDIDAMYTQGLLSARPAFGKVGREYYASDNGNTYLDLGTTWVIKGSSNLLQTGDVQNFHGIGTFAARPAAGAFVGYLYYANDTGGLFRWQTGSWVLISVNPLVVTNFPTPLHDGQEIILQPAGSSDAYPPSWTFRYSSGTLRWHFLGGQPWRKLQSGNFTGATGGSFQQWPGLTFTLPGPSGAASYRGVYDVMVRGKANATSTASTSMLGVQHGPGAVVRTNPEVGRIVIGTVDESILMQETVDFTPTTNELTTLDIMNTQGSASVATLNLSAGEMYVQPRWLASS